MPSLDEWKAQLDQTIVRPSFTPAPSSDTPNSQASAAQEALGK